MILLLLSCAEPMCPLWYTDLDGDGYGLGEGVGSCESLDGRSRWEGDCDDRNAQVHPGAIDAPSDGIDQNCDGVDPCETSIRVSDADAVDCTGGVEYSFDGNLRHWPGDCICEVAGDVILRGDDVPILGPIWVGGKVTLGSTEDPWSGQGMDNLEGLGRTLELNIDANTEMGLASLGHDLYVRSQEGASLRLPKLKALSGALHTWTSLTATELAEARDIAIYGGWVNLPKLREAEHLDLQGGGVEAGSLARIRSLEMSSLFAPEMEQKSWIQSFPVLATVPQVTVNAGELELPRLLNADTLYIVGGTLHANAITEVDDLYITGEIHASNLCNIETLLASGDLYLPALEGVEKLELTGSLDSPRLNWVDELDLWNGVILHLVSEIHTAHIHAEGQAAGTTQLRVNNLDTLKAYPGHAQVLGPEHLETVLVGKEGSLTLLRTRSLTKVQALGPFDAPELMDADILTLYTPEWHLTSLRSVRVLYLSDCMPLPALRAVPETIVANCTLDLRQATAYPKRLELSGGGEILVADPYPGSIVIQYNGFRVGAETIDGALTIQSTAIDAGIHHVTGNVLLQVSGVELGSLNTLLSIGKDLNYCAPDIPAATLQAWIETVDIGGSVTNSCP